MIKPITKVIEIGLDSTVIKMVCIKIVVGIWLLIRKIIESIPKTIKNITHSSFWVMTKLFTRNFFLNVQRKKSLEARKMTVGET